MDALIMRVGVCPWSFAVGGSPNQFLPSLRTSLFRCAHQQLKTRSARAIIESASNSTIEGSEIDREDLLQVFLEERKLSGDFISKVSDALWRRDVLVFDEPEKVSSQKDTSQVEEAQFAKESVEDEGYNGLLKLIKTKEWISVEGLAPTNRKLSAQERVYNCERTRKLNLLEYEALKREMLLSTAGIGVACSGYCLLTLSIQAAVSYAIGVVFSCLYLQLLCYHSDKLSKKDVPLIFLQKSPKKIGIRSEDLKKLIERTVKGSSIALSSPRLVIIAALYGIWGLSHQLASNFFDFQIVPAMLGLFAYKGAALVQVYRDNKGLRLIPPENDEFSN